MACKKGPKVYLGYDDEYVTEKHRSLVHYTTNKIGGKPVSPNEKSLIRTVKCKLCGLRQLLALQIYAPLENSRYHRTLYIFACINPNCWNQNESWTCLRVQTIDDQSTITNKSDNGGLSAPSTTTSWLSDADDWEEDTNDNVCEENGNNRSYDEQELVQEVSNLRVGDPNANSDTSIESLDGGGAVGRLVRSPLASADIEGEESEVVCIDSPTQPQNDLIDLLHEVTPIPLQHSESQSHVNRLSFVEIFMRVAEEDTSIEEDEELEQHVHDLYLEYKLSDAASPMSSDPMGDGTETENYDAGIPIHGDEMCDHFLNRIKKNPRQILRYCRDNSAALLLSPLRDGIGTCDYCGSDRIFELQVLPTITRILRLDPTNGANVEIDFGTVLVYTCSMSCWSPDDLYKEEHVIVQAERI